MNSSYNDDAEGRGEAWRRDRDAQPRRCGAPRLAGGRYASIASNETGRLELRSAIADIVPAGVALSHKSRWPKLSKQHANINALNPGRKTDMAESSAVHSVEVTLTKSA